MKFRKKTVVIDAIQFTDPGLYPQIVNFTKEKCGPLQSTGNHLEWRIPIKTLEGEMYCSLGDWIIKGVKGEFYPCKPDIFAATYECYTGPEPVEKETK